MPPCLQGSKDQAAGGGCLLWTQHLHLTPQCQVQAPLQGALAFSRNRKGTLGSDQEEKLQEFWA